MVSMVGAGIGCMKSAKKILAYMKTDILLVDGLKAFRSAGIRKGEEKMPETNRKATILIADNFSDKMWRLK
jgi:hypothetical protein